MKKDRVRVIAISAVLLILFHEAVFRIAALFYRDASGPRAGHVQQYNSNIAEHAQWALYLLFTGVWVYLHFKRHASDYKQLAAMIASITGIYAAYTVTLSLVTLLIKPDHLPGGLRVNYDWILMSGVMTFLMVALYSGALAVPFIGIGAVIRRRKESAALPDVPDTDLTEQIVSANTPVKLLTLRHVISEAGRGCLAGLLLAGVMQLSVLASLFIQLLLTALPPVMALYEEFMMSLSSPFVPWTFHKWEKLYAHVMPFILLGGLGSLVGATLGFFESLSQKKYGLPTYVKIGIYVGAIIGLSRGFMLYAVDYLIQDVMRVVGIALGWITAGVIIVLLVAALRRLPLIKVSAASSVKAGLSPSQKAVAVVCSLLVLAMVSNEGVVFYDRHQHTVSEKARKIEQQERDARKGLRLGNLVGWKTAEGEVVISGYVSNEMNILKSWMITAVLYAKDGNVTKTSMLVNGEQRYSSQDYESFKKRGIPYAVFRGENHQLQPKATTSFQFIITDAPVSSETFTVYLKDVDFNQLAADDLWRSRTEIEKYLKQNAEHKEDKRAAEAEVPERTVDQSPYPVHLNWTWEPNLPAVSKEQLAAIRKERIERYKFLNIYASPYTPDPVVYGQIDPATDWLQDTPLFIHNPYLLVSESGGNFVNSLFPYCSASSIVYSNHSITVRYDDLSARKWLNEVEHLTEMPGMIRLWFPNALDAGYKFAHVDRAQSVNVAPIDNASEAHVMNAVYVPHDYYHRGRLGHNNISPNDENAKLKLVNVKARTVIFVKLWKSRPQSANDKEDFSYVIKVEPERREVL